MEPTLRVNHADHYCPLDLWGI